MTRFAPQPDLFASPPQPAAPQIDPLEELQALLARLRATEHPPWPHAAAAIEEELYALSLARQAGPEGNALAMAILEETERLLAATD